MKRYVYVLCLALLSAAGLSSCSKSSDPAPVSPVIGRWQLNKALLSGFTAPNTNLNGLGLDLYNNGIFQPYNSQIDIRADKSFLDNYKSGGLVDDVSGTWDFSNNLLTLKYDDGTTESLNYQQTGSLEELISTKIYDITLPGDSTSTVSGKFQYVYRK
ncbi:lipocalin family protein [Spirosoma sp. SC4-14]|uniref:lipocalin family protein n=1 Tax=Spirosoma sp. SC4-14 TaxID=3128900 RepID=UPI0030CAC029